MWNLKIKYSHSDCIYAPKLKKLQLNCLFNYLGEYTKGDYVFTSAMIFLYGKPNNILKYFRYLRKHSKIVKCSIKNNVIFVLAKHHKSLSVYEAAYDSKVIKPAPAYLSSDGFEIIEYASWDRKNLEEMIKKMKSNETTTHLEILRFSKLKTEDIFVSRLLPNIAKKQRESFELALKNGYYSFPRKTNLDTLAKMSKVSKATFRENLRKAEIKMLYIILSPR